MCEFILVHPNLVYILQATKGWMSSENEASNSQCQLILYYLPQSLPPVEDCDIPFPENGQLCPIAKVIHHTESLGEI